MFHYQSKLDYILKLHILDLIIYYRFTKVKTISYAWYVLFCILQFTN